MDEFRAIAPIHDRALAVARELAALKMAGRNDLASLRLNELHTERDALLEQLDRLRQRVAHTPD